MALVTIAVATGAQAAYGQATLLSGSVRAISPGVEHADVSGAPGTLWNSDLPVIAENTHTGERWVAKTDGISNQPFALFTFDGLLPPGLYRVLVQDVDERGLGWLGKVRTSETYVVVQEYHPVHVDIVLPPVPDDNPASAATPVAGRVRRLTLADTCRGGSPNEVPSPARGELWGVVQTRGGKPASGVRVHLEAIGGVTRDPFRASVRTTDSGCYGLRGLWPARYHVYVNEPPFVFDSEVEVRDVRDRPTRLDIELSSDRQKADVPLVKPGWYSRLGLRDGGLDDVWRAVLEMEPAIWAASRAGTIDSADMAHVSGVVYWPYGPDGARQYHRMPGVRIEFEHKESRDPIPATTDADGAYELWLPQGRYRVGIKHPPFAPLVADVLVLPEGLVVREGLVLGSDHQSGVSPPQVTRRSGLATDLNFVLWLPVQERLGVETAAGESGGVVTVRGSDFASSSARPTDITVGREDVERLPLVNDRTAQAALTGVPGVVATGANGNLAVFTGLGQRRFSNRLTIDGINVDLAIDASGFGIGQPGSGSLPAASTLGGSQVLVPLDAVEQMRIQTAGVAPDRRLTPGVLTSVVTRAGTDIPTTSFFGQARPNAWSAHDLFEDTGRRPRRSTDAWTGAASAGGPFVHSRLFGFAAWEGQWVDQLATASMRAPTQAIRDSASPMVRSILDAYPIGEGRDFGSGVAEHTQDFTTISWFSSFSGRLDAVLSASHRLFGRLQQGTSRGDEILRELALPPRAYTSKESTATTAVTIGWSAAFSSWIHDLRVNVTRHGGGVDAITNRDTGVAALPTSPFLPEGIREEDASVRVRLFPGNGGTLFFGRTSDVGQHQVQLADSVVLLRGNHQWHVGGEFQRVLSSSTPPPYLLFYQFRGIPDLQKGQVESVTIGRMLPARTERHAWSVFAHDTWKVSRRVSLGLGLRYSVRPAPTSRNGTQPVLVDYDALPLVRPRPSGARLWDTSWRDVAPQISGTYELRTTPNWATTLHGSYGLAIDDLTAPGLIPFGWGDGFVSTTFLGLSAFPLPAGSLEKAMPVPFVTEAYAMPTNLRRPRTYEWQLGFEQSLGPTQRLGVAYVGTAGRDLTYWSGHNLESDPIYAYSNDAESDYHALLVRYVKRLSRGVQGRLGYAWGHALDTNSGEEHDRPNLPPTLRPLSLSRGSADFDRRHVLQGSASYQLPALGPSWFRKGIGEWDIAVVGTVQSGAPITVLADQGGFSVRPNLNPGVPTWIADSASPSGRRLNAAAFTTPTSEGHGTLGRNTLRAWPLRQVDLSISRTERLRGLRIQVRIDAFNVLNTEHFGSPESRLEFPGFGEPKWSYADDLGTGTLTHGGLAPISQLGGPRSIRLSVRVQM